MYIIISLLTDSDEYEEESADIAKPLPTYGQLSSSVEGFRTYLEMKTNVPNTVFTSLNVLENYIEDEKWKNVLQTKITDYYK